MCNCIDEMKARVLAKMKENGSIPEGSDIVDTTMQGEGFSLSPNVGQQLMGKVETEFYKMTAKGKVSKKVSRSNMLLMYAYCPICGEKYKKDEAEKSDEA